ncbi:lytic transglycosylase domain-containing protein [Pararhodospirillum oryzae]|uniref:Lytic transglycosylase n=1 Tax=Pararhodospirillum oryzae TaxID=478448 RepID=A0A512HBB3_9PROT|nr:lytic transglycosylase domain-containing protein [Pararhodospirillum oryzae]GEO82744.1 lytic transglycosylase [Pararhodospirillum oryzae]
MALRLIGRLFAGLLVVIVLPGLTWAAGRPASLSAADAATYAAAFRAADLGRWGEARALADSANDKTLRDVIVWRHMRTGPPDGPSLDERLAFLNTHPDWPLTGTIRRLIEEGLLASPGGVPETLALFQRFPPVSPAGKRALARALLASGNTARATALLREVWVDGDFSTSDEAETLNALAPYLRAEDHWARADRLLWDGDYDDARRMVPRLDAGRAAVVQARVVLGTGQGNPDAAVNAVPAALQNDPGLVFERVRWRRRAGLDDGAIDLLLKHGSRGGRDQLWWTERAILLRDALDQGHISVAYKLAAGHERDEGTAFAEGEWLAGWIALRFLRDARMALPHFRTLYDGVSSPISRSRAAYWAGRAAQALKRPEEAARWYGLAAAHPTTFYGQMAAARLRLPLHTLLPPTDPLPSAEEAQALAGDRMMRIAAQLIELERHDELLSFMYTLVGAHPGTGARAALADLVLSAGLPEMAVRLARRAAQDATVLLAGGYPLPDGLTPAVLSQARNTGLPAAAAFGIIRQESNFDHEARSSAGALGLMQLLPSTARAMAQVEGVAFDPALLTRDPAFNTRLGTRYLANLMDRFDGSLVLAAAGYNAGPSRPAQWIQDHGDPRQMTPDEAIDWIEQIPFRETRNYVQRVFEGALVYRLRLGETLASDTPTTNLIRFR